MLAESVATAYDQTMASMRSKLMNFATRGVMGLIFRRVKPVSEYRLQMDRMDKAQEKPPLSGILFEEIDAPDAPIHGRWIRNQQEKANQGKPQTILYLHGGAFSFRMVHAHSVMVSGICLDAGASAFMPWYRLAPEHPFPAAPEDCLTAYRYLLDSGHAASNIVVMGDSAGGNLALSLLHMIKRAGLPMPSGVITMSPITDAVQISASWRLNKRIDPMYVVQDRVNPARWYFQGQNPLDPAISPYYGDFSGFPPLYFIVGGIEALLEDSVGMVRKAIDVGIPAKVQIWCGMPHVFPLNSFLPESRYAKIEIVKWLAELHLGKSAVPKQKHELYHSCVEVFDLKPFSHRLVRETNDVYLDLAPIDVYLNLTPVSK
jgi:epsilon-lactone hydrolase